MKKTVLYLRTDLGTADLQAGGSVSHTLGVIRGLQREGYTVHAASSAMLNNMQTLSLPLFIPLCMPRLAMMCGFKIACLLSNIIFFYKARVLCYQQQALFLYQRYSLLNVVGVMLSWWYRIPLVLEFNGSEVWVDEHWSKTRWLRIRWLIAWIEKLNVQYAHTIIVVSQVLKDELIAQGVSVQKIVMHPNGVDVDYFNPIQLQAEREIIRQSLEIQDCVVFGFIGTFSYWHGIEVLAHMIPVVTKKWPNAHFLLIGDGPLRRFLQDALQCVDRQVHFLGTISHEYARNYLAACDAFLLPTQPNPDGTKFFGSPTKLFEYMSMGKPIIASDIEQISLILNPALSATSCAQNTIVPLYELGILISPEDKDGFVSAAVYILAATKSQRETFGLNARTKVSAYYTWQHHIRALSQFTTVT